MNIFKEKLYLNILQFLTAFKAHIDIPYIGVHIGVSISFSRKIVNTTLRFQELVAPERSINAGTRVTRGKIKRNYTVFGGRGRTTTMQVTVSSNSS